jgi:polyribonucleotide nucleotidyltransferase
LLHISEVAEHRIKDVRDELKEGDQVLVKVLAVEGNRIKLSRKAILKEQRAKMSPAGGAPPPDAEGAQESAPSASHEAPTTVIEGGADFEENEAEPNFNRVDAAVGGESSVARPEGGRDGRPGAGGDRNRRRRGRGRGPGGGPGGGHGGHGGGHGGGGGRGRR